MLLARCHLEAVRRMLQYSQQKMLQNLLGCAVDCIHAVAQKQNIPEKFGMFCLMAECKSFSVDDPSQSLQANFGKYIENSLN
jgi:hypothetical protein